MQQCCVCVCWNLTSKCVSWGPPVGFKNETLPGAGFQKWKPPGLVSNVEPLPQVGIEFGLQKVGLSVAKQVKIYLGEKCKCEIIWKESKWFYSIDLDLH